MGKIGPHFGAQHHADENPAGKRAIEERVADQGGERHPAQREAQGRRQRRAVACGEMENRGGEIEKETEDQ